MNHLLEKINSGSNVDRKTYSLDETLTIMFMLGKDKSLKDVSEVTGRTIHSLRYKKSWFKKFKDVDSIYQNFKVDPEDEEKTKKRVENFIKSRKDS